MRQTTKRCISSLLACILILGNFPVPAFAQEADGLCDHHPEHTETCGYSPAVEGHACSHEHTEECYRSDTQCVHSHGNCSFVPAVEGQDCDCQPDENGEIVHTEGCGYVEAVAGVPCDHVCSGESGCITQVLDCQHIHNYDECGYVEDKAEVPCTFVCEECTAGMDKESEEKVPEEEDDSDKDTAAKEAADREAANTVAALIAALPTLEEIQAMSTEEQAEAYRQVNSAYEAYCALTDDQKALIPEAEGTFDLLFDYFSSLTAPAPDNPTSGTCGENLTWALTDDGVLTISGSGAMTDFPSEYWVPWNSYREEITAVNLPEGITSIGTHAFIKCIGLASISIPEGVTSIGTHAFFECTGLTSISIPEGVTSIGPYVFCECTGLTSVTIPEGVVSIGDSVFYECTGLTSVSIPESVTSIGTSAFWGCTGLTSISIPKGVTSIGDNTFKSCTSLISVTIPEGVVSIGGGAFGGCTSLTSISIPEGVTSIGDSAFSSTKLTSLVIPSSVSSIGRNAFSWCEELTSITFGHIATDPLTIGERAFYANTSKLHTTIGVPYPRAIHSALRSYAYFENREITWVETETAPVQSISIHAQNDIDQAEVGLETTYEATLDPDYSTSQIIWSIVEGSDGGNAYVRKGEYDTATVVGTAVGTVTVRCTSADNASVFGEASLTILPPTAQLESVAVITDGEFPNEVELGKSIQMMPVFTPANASERDVIWSVENGTGKATIDQDGVLTGLTTGTVTVYATAANGSEGSCTVNVLRYVEDITILLEGKEGPCSLGIGQKLQLSALLTPEDTTTSGVTWSVEDGTGSASIKTYNDYSSVMPVLTGVSAGTVTLTATANDSRQVTASLELTVSDSIRTYAVTGGNLYYNAETGIITGSDRTVTDAAIPAVIDGVTITGIAPYAFAEKDSSSFLDTNTTLASVSIPNTVTEIGDYAFYRCSKLSSLRFVSGSRLTTIGKKAFNGCSSLVTLTIPDSVAHVGEDAFYLSNLKYLTVSGELDTSSWLSYSGSTLESVTFTGSKIISKPHRVENNSHSFGYMPGRNAKKVILSDSVQAIEAYAFSGCYLLTQVTMGAGVTTIGEYAFSSCDGLTQLTMGAGVTTIGEYAFFSCRGLTQVTMGAGVTTIGAYAFSDCDGLTQVTMGAGVTTIGAYAFSGCYKLTSINLPDSLETIGRKCFEGCNQLQLIDLSAIPDVMVEKRCSLTGQADVPPALIRATGGKVNLDWYSNTIEGEPDSYKIVGIYGDVTGRYWMEAWSAGRFTLICQDEYTGAQGRKTVEVKVGTVIRPTDTDYLVSGKKLQLSAYLMPAEEKLSAQWEIIAGTDYATLSPSGLLTAGAVTRAQQVTLTATPTNGSEVATKTLWILPKATSISLKLVEDPLGDTLDVDMCKSNTLTLSAESYPEDAQDTVTWASNSSTVAQVNKATGEITLKKPGTAVITATAADGSGVKTSVKLNVAYLDTAKTLRATADIPNTSLQPGQTALVTVSGENAIAPEALDFSTSNPSIATVDSQGIVTAGDTPGTVTITATLRGDPLKRKASVKIPVIAMQAAAVTLKVDGEAQSELTISKESQIRTYTLTTFAQDYRGESLTPKMIWASTDPAVAEVSVAKDGTVTLTIPADASGECIITATANDRNRVSTQLTVSVRDYSPRLTTSKITLNSYSEQGIALDLRESYDNAIVSAKLAGAPEGLRLDELTLYGQTLKNGTYSMQLLVTCENGSIYPYTLQVKIANSLPSVTVKQMERFNLFYLDSTARLSLASSGQTITAVELEDTTDFTVSYLDGMATLLYTENPAAKPDTRATLKVWLEGYNTPVSKTVTISTISTSPRLSLNPASSIINTALNDSRSIDLKIWNQTEGCWLTPDTVEYDAEFADIFHSGDTVTLVLKENTGGKASIWVQQDNWVKPIKLSHKVTVTDKLPTIKLGTARLTLNRYFTAQSAATSVTLSQENLVLGNVTLISTAKAGTSAALEAAKLDVYYSPDDGCIHAEIPGDAPKAGTYTYSVRGILSNGETELSGGTLSVVVSSSLPSVRLSASSVRLNRYLAGQESAALTVKVPTGYKLEGFKNMDEILDLEGNVLAVQITPDAPIGKRTLTLYPILKHIATDQTVTLPTALKLTVQVYESSSLKVSLSTRGRLDTLNPDSVMVYTPRLTNCIGSIDGVSLAGANADKFYVELVDGKIILSLLDGQEYATNVTYKVQFLVSVCGEEILSPVVNVKVTQSKVKLTAFPTALTLYQSQTAPLSIRLTQSIGEIYDISISSKTSAELLAALGADGLDEKIDDNVAVLELSKKNAAHLKAGKSYNLYLDITPKNNATNLKPAQIKLTVKAMK